MFYMINLNRLPGSTIDRTTYQNEVVVEWILKNVTPENVNLISYCDAPPLCFPECFLDAIPHLLKMGANPNTMLHNTISSSYRFPLLACLQSDVPAYIMIMYIDYGADVNLNDLDGHSALYWAINKYPTTVKYGNEMICMTKIMVLIDRGAIINPIWETELVEDPFYHEVLIPTSFRVPEWVKEFIKTREECRHVSIVLCGIGKHHLLQGVQHVDSNVLKLMAKHVWSNRNEIL